MRSRKKSSNAIEEAQRGLERAQHEYLRSHGWEYSSSNPACTWLWQKQTPDGRTFLLETEIAVAVQRSSCAIRGNEW